MGSGEGVRRRELGVMWQEIDEEVLVFDTERSRAHSLNPTATTVWQACDGHRDPEQIAAHCGLDPDTVVVALERLHQAQLLQNDPPPAQAPGVSRRGMLKRTLAAGAAAGVAIPVIRSITAPSIAMAASHHKGKAGQHCTNNSQCSPAPTSFCNSSLHSCQHSLGASCSNTSSCQHGSYYAYVCLGGVCTFCSTNSQCPGSHSTCSGRVVCF